MSELNIFSKDFDVSKVCLRGYPDIELSATVNKGFVNVHFFDHEDKYHTFTYRQPNGSIGGDIKDDFDLVLGKEKK